MVAVYGYGSEGSIYEDGMLAPRQEYALNQRSKHIPVVFRS